MLDLTRDRLASCVECSAATIEKLENGERRPSRQIAALIGICLQVPDDLSADFVLFARGGPLPDQLSRVLQEQKAGQPGGYLPTPPTEFIGRVAEIAAVRDLLLEPGVRLVTLMGPPGIGKTRLAIEAASGLYSHFTGGIYYVPLSGLTNASMVLPTIAAALGIRHVPHQPLTAAIAERLGSERLLLVLDNFEHLIAATPDIGPLLSGAPGLSLLATSRAALRIYGEHTFVVPPLSLPQNSSQLTAEDYAAVSRYEAVALFTKRARAANHDFVLTADNAAQVLDICRRLDGLPLAIELAANRAKVLTPGQLLERLGVSLDLLADGARDLPSRQQSLRGAISWGYDLLTQQQQSLFRAIALFADGCSLEALQFVAPSALGQPDSFVSDVSALVESSLVVRQVSGGGMRFSMLDTIREFGHEKLVEHGELDISRKAHAAYYLQLVEDAEPELQGGSEAAWLHRLGEEHANLNAAYSYFAEIGDGVSMSRMSSALRRFWYVRGDFLEGQAWLKQALMYADGLPRDLLAKTLHGLGTLNWSVGDLASAELYFNESLAIWRTLGDKRGIANMLNNLGITLLPQDRFEEAVGYHGESLQLYREIGDAWGIALALANMGLVALNSGDYSNADALLNESLFIRREAGDKHGVAQSLNNLGIVARCRGDIEQSCDLHNESLEMFRALGDRWSAALALSNLGYAELDGGIPGAPLRFLKALPLFKELGTRSDIAGCLEGLAQVAVREGNSELAGFLFGAAEKMRSLLGSALLPYNRLAYSKSLASAKALLGERAFNAVWQRGSRADIDSIHVTVNTTWRA